MALPPDLHMHTPLCRHATGEPVDYARRALEIGLTEIGFTDHSPMPRDDFDDWRMRADQLDEYVAKVRRAQKEFPQLTIRLGLEVDYLPGYEDWIRDLAARHPWDYFIGSVHYVSETWAVDNPYKLSEWKNRDPWEVWSVYFDRLTMAAETGFFEVIGHADLPKKFGHRPNRDCKPLYEKFLNAAKKHNCALDVNTAGLRKDCKEIYPSRELLQIAFQKGVPITFGSDAHAPEEVGMNFKEAVQLAREVGYTESWRFTRRQRETVSIAKTWFDRAKEQLSKWRILGDISHDAMSIFSPHAQQVLALARKEADRFNHNFVGTEHLLLGLIRLGQGVAVNVLQKLGLDLETIRREVEKQIGTRTDQKVTNNFPYTPRVKKVLAHASTEAKALNHTYVGTEHILLGLLCEGDGVATRVLKNFNLSLEQARKEILIELDPNFTSDENNQPDA